MPLQVGQQLGSYEITSMLGKGGMGEVYRARDTKLKRDIAIKILPDEFSRDPDRVSRFQREAETLALLNHQNIGAIYDIQQNNGTRFLILEFVEGDTLAEILKKRGVLPVDEALAIAKQIYEALEAAHEKGIVHRDLKPANVKILPNGKVKVLDFGLAKGMENAPTNAALSNSPTLVSMGGTNAGIILGTAAYMSPEQAKGRTVDKRTDIFAFGCVLYEMLTGHAAFEGEHITEILSRVLQREPDWNLLPVGVPQRVKDLLRLCLEKDLTKRRRDAGDVRIDIEQALTEPAAAIPANAPVRSSRLPWMVAIAAMLVAAAVAVVSFLRVHDRPVDQRRVHLSVPLPGNTAPPHFALSPDGRSLVMTYQSGLGIRSLDSGEMRILTGTVNARTPFWSPDSRTIAFFAERKLKAVAASGGPPMTLCENTGTGAGGTWNRAGIIVFATELGVLNRVSAAGGQCTELAKREPGVPRLIPVFLPDGDHFLYALRAPDEARRGVYVASLGDPNGRRLLTDLSSAMFVSNGPGSNQGRLLFVREGQTLMAQVFDPTSLQLSGDPVVVADQVSFTFTQPQIAASADTNGTLMYLTNGRPDRQMVWYSRSGTQLGVAPKTGYDGNAVSLAPDGKRVAFTRVDAQGFTSLWLQNLEREQETSLTKPPFNTGAAVWSPDGQRVAFRATGSGAPAIYIKNVNGGKEDILLQGTDPWPSDWSRDDHWLVYTESNPKTGTNIWLLPDPSKPSADRKPVKLLGESFYASQGQISPDGKWLAYFSDESGTGQVYLRPFNGLSPVSDTKWQLSTARDRSGEPRWRADGKELFYLEFPTGTQRIKLMSVAIGSLPNPAGAPKQLFEFVSRITIQSANNFVYSPAADGQSFLINVYPTDAQPSLEVIQNWARTPSTK